MCSRFKTRPRKPRSSFTHKEHSTYGMYLRLATVKGERGLKGPAGSQLIIVAVVFTLRRERVIVVVHH
eukprot:scaffold145251_cov73-Cyclotella_meneghiniana.AAC.1